VNHCNARLWAQGECFQHLLWTSKFVSKHICFLVPHLQWPGSQKESKSCQDHSSTLGGPKTK
jgi:hypothetical protein